MTLSRNKAIWNIIVTLSSLGLLLLLFLYWNLRLDLYKSLFIGVILFTLYILCFLQTIIMSSRKGQQKYKFQIIMLTLPAILYSVLIIMSAEVFKSKQLFKAVVKTDKFQYYLVFRNNGVCEREMPYFLPIPQKSETSTYYVQSDTLLIIKQLYSDKPTADTLYLDWRGRTLYTQRNEQGNFIKTKVPNLSLYHYEIVE